ncbi:MAG TPA: 3',5'-cyclic-nucleotide phosphodiesterase [candidate division Zixibacteria bacterium]|nr:3',5'-cyclic-nucleotide phosphodiesterase [candidate division Zixibacteria bacterium]
MKIRVLGCSGGQIPGYRLSSFLIDDSLLVDAGSATAALSLAAQRKIRHVLVTHTHLDHVGTLGPLADNLFGNRTQVTVWSDREIVRGLRRYFFNDQIWPDFTRITARAQRIPVLRLRPLPRGRATAVGRHRVTGVPVNHVVPSVALFIERDSRTLLHVGDTGPTERVWSAAARCPTLRAVVVETSFPNRLQEIADASRHLTPRTLAAELKKLGERAVPILITHLKPEYRREIIGELRAMKDPRVRILKDGDVIAL